MSSLHLYSQIMEAKLQKLKVTELKELLSKHGLTQTGKKDDLIQRLVENNISPEEETEELVDIEEPSNTNAAPTAPVATETPALTPPVETAAPLTTTTATAPSSATTETEEAPKELTAEQKALKARAERFGLPFNPDPTPKRPAPAAAPAPATTTAALAPAAKKEKPAAIDRTANLGLSEEVLAKRAAKFGLPEKKQPVAPLAQAAPAAAAPPKTEEVSPEVAARIAEEEEKKRKRAEKFGTGKPASNGSAVTNGTEPDAKRTKV